MATTTREQEIIGLEREYWEGIKNKDLEATLRLTAEPCIVTGAQGVARIDHKTYEQMAKSESWTVNQFEIVGEPEVIFLTDDVAVIAYKVREEMTVEGKPMTLEAADASTWVRQNGDWVCALHTESILGDPFGRDRKN